MVIKPLSSAGLFTHPHYKVNLSGDYSGINILCPILWVFSCAGLFGSSGGCSSMMVMNDAFG